MGPMALMELNYAIYDGLEMKCSMVQMMIDEAVLVSSVLCPVSSLFLMDGPEIDPSVTFYCPFPPPNGLERSQMVHGGLTTI